MRRLAGFLSDALLWLILLGIALGAAQAALDWIGLHAGLPTVFVPRPVALGSGLVALLLGAWLHQRFVPLLALSEERWVYRDRPRGELHGVSRTSALHLGAFGAYGLFIGSCLGFPWTGTALAVALRALPLLRRGYRLASLLSAGRRSLVGTATFTIQDADFVSDAFAASWGSWRPLPPTSNQLRLAFRRLRRRSYIPLALALIVATTLACANALGAVGVSWLIWGITAPTVPAFIVAGVFWTGARRGRPRHTFDLTSVDSGFGVMISPALLDYYLTGLVVGTGCAALAALALIA